MDEIGDRSGNPMSADGKGDETQPFVDRAIEQAKQIYGMTFALAVSVVGGVFVILLVPAILIGMVLRRLLPIAGLLAFVLGVIIIARLWIVPGQVMDVVTQSKQVSATGTAILTFGGGGVAMIVVGGLIDELFERYIDDD